MSAMNRIFLLMVLGLCATHLLLGQNKPNATKSLSPVVPSVTSKQSKDTVRFEVEPLKINTEYAEIAPMFYKQNFLYTLIKTKKAFSHQELRWHKYPEVVPCIIPHPDSATQIKPILTATSETWHFNTGIAAPIPNTEKIIITRSLHKKLSFKDLFSKPIPERLGLFEANTNGDVWFNLQPIFPLDTLDYSEAHPTLSEDGKTLYFVSDMAGGYGGTDIYVTHRDENGHWSVPINLGDKINTSDNELYPFVHSDKNLYFASNRKGGFGGYDIYEAIWDGEQFARVVNMGIPTNSNKDDISFIVNEPKRICYFSSNRDGGEGSFDIYKMNVKLLNISRNLTDGGENLFGVLNIEISGKVVDSLTGQPVKRAMVKLRDFNNDDIQVVFADNKGNYKFSISNDNKFQIAANRIGYNSSPDYQFSTYGLSSPTPLSIDIYMKPVIYTVTLDVSVFETSQTLDASILPIIDAKLSLKENTSGKLTEAKTNANGTVQFTLEQGKVYKLVVTKDGYQTSLPYSISTVQRHNAERIELNISLTRLETGSLKDFVIKAVVKDKDTNKAIPFAAVLLKNIDTKEITEKITDDNGIALFEVDTTHSYSLESIKEKYQLDNYVHIFPKGMQTGVVSETILPMKQVTYVPVPLDFVFEPIYYPTGKMTFDNDIMKQLDEVYKLLQKYKSIRISIVGHTDNEGSRESNLILSQKRANAAYNYLVKKGLPKNRVISVTGAGDERPAVNCSECSTEQNQKNRRTELIIVER